MKKKRRLLAFSLLLLGVLLLAGGLFWLLNRQPAHAVPEFANAGSIGVWGPLRISLPVLDGITADYEFDITPSIPYQAAHSGNQVELRFTSPGDPAVTYTLSATPSDDIPVARPAQWQFTLRQPEVIYLILQRNGSDLWIVSPEERQPQQLTATNGSIRDYAVRQDGEQILFSAANSQAGTDIWAVDRDGGNMRQIIECGPQQCSGAVYRPLHAGFSYIRLDRTTDGEPHAQIILFDQASARGQVVYEQTGTVFSDLNWSPDGRVLAFVDETLMQMHFYFSENGEISTVDCQSSQTGGWSVDGSMMVFACSTPEQTSPCMDLKQVDPYTMLITESPLQALNGQRDYSPPVFSWDGKWIVFGERCFSDRPTRQLWLADAHSQDGSQITNDALYNFANYHWDPFSSMLVLQRYEMGSASAAPDIMLWRLETEALEMLAEGGHSPNWLP